MIPKFEKENPGYKINATSYEWVKLHDKVLVSANAHTLPDVARLDIAWVPEFQKLNILVPVDKEMSDFSQYSSSLLENAMSTAKIGANYYALALNTNTKILFYNKNALKQANVPVPKTMEDFAAAAKNFRAKTAVVSRYGDARNLRWQDGMCFLTSGAWAAKLQTATIQKPQGI